MSRSEAFSARMNRTGGAKSILESRKMAKMGKKKIVESDSDSDSDKRSDSDHEKPTLQHEPEPEPVITPEPEKTPPAASSPQQDQQQEKQQEEEGEVPWYLQPYDEAEDQVDEDDPIHDSPLLPVHVPYFPEKKKNTKKKKQSVVFADTKIGKFLYTVYPFAATEAPTTKRVPEISNSFKHRSKLKAQWVQEKASWISQKQHFQDRMASQRSASSFLEQRRLAREQKLREKRMKKSKDDSDSSGSDSESGGASSSGEESGNSDSEDQNNHENENENKNSQETEHKSKDEEELVQFLKDLGLGDDEVSKVTEKHSTLAELLSTPKEKIDTIPLKFGPKKKLQTAVAARKQQSTPPSSSPVSVTGNSSPSVSSSPGNPSTTQPKFAAKKNPVTSPSSSPSPSPSPASSSSSPAPSPVPSSHPPSAAAVLASTSPSANKGVFGKSSSPTISSSPRTGLSSSITTNSTSPAVHVTPTSPLSHSAPTPASSTSPGTMNHEVQEFIERLKLKSYANHFEGMDLKGVKNLTEEELKNFGIPFTLRKIIHAEQEKIIIDNQTSSTPASTSAPAPTLATTPTSTGSTSPASGEAGKTFAPGTTLEMKGNPASVVGGGGLGVTASPRVGRANSNAGGGGGAGAGKLEGWLKEIGLSQYISVLQEKSFDYDKLVKVASEDELKVLNLPFGPRKKLYAEIQKVNQK